MKKIKVAIVTVSTERIGPNRVILNIIQGLDKSKFEIFLLSLSSKGWSQYVKQARDMSDELAAAGAKIVNLKIPKGVDLFLAVPKLIRAIKRIGPDIIHTHLLRGNIYGRIAARLSKIPVVSTIHNEDRWVLGKTFIDWVTHKVDQYTLPFAQAFIAVAPNVKEFLLQHESKIPEEKIIVIRNSVDTRVFFKDEKVREQKRRELGLINEMKAVATVGRFDTQKDPLALVDAMSIVFSKNNLAKFFWVGEGPLRSAVEKRMREKNIENRFILLGERQDVSQLLRAFDVFVLSSLHEGLPIALLEAMATGIAPVATNVSGNRVVIEDGKSGLLAKVSNPQSIAQRIVYLLEHEEARKSISEEAVRRIQTDYSLEQFCKLHEELYLRVLAATKSLD
jgi:glycosyltransferase involved in cell wall biosynthesis